jgi:hypothetical protein
VGDEPISLVLARAVIAYRDFRFFFAMPRLGSSPPPLKDLGFQVVLSLISLTDGRRMSPQDFHCDHPG